MYVTVVVVAVVSCGGVASARWAPSGTGTAINKTTTKTKNLSNLELKMSLTCKRLCGGQALKTTTMLRMCMCVCVCVVISMLKCRSSNSSATDSRVATSAEVKHKV